MVRLKSFIAIAALVIASFAVPAIAQTEQYMQGQTAQVALSHATQAGDIALLVRYNGRALISTKPSGTLETTTTTLLFKSGLITAEAADSSVTCPSGGTAGTIDLTHADCNTVGEVVDIINASSGDRWKAVNYAALRTDSTNNKFIASAASSANIIAGKAVVWDTSKTLYFGGVITSKPNDISVFLTAPNDLKPKPDVFTLNRVSIIRAWVAITATAPTLVVYSIDPTFKDTGSSEVVTSVYGQPLVTATSTDLNFIPFGLLCRKGEKCMIRLTGTVATTVPYLYLHASQFLLQ